MLLSQIVFWLGIFDALLALAAAYYWFKSAKVQLPEDVMIVSAILPVQGAMSSTEGPIEEIAVSSAEPIEKLAMALREQGALSKIAASYASGAALLQGFIVVLTQFVEPTCCTVPLP